MDNQLKLEELGMFILGLLLFATLNYSWWLFPALLLIPDISMAGYAINNKVGASLYNLFHHKGLAVMVFAAGSLLEIPEVMLAGIILFAHSSLDRLFGYGLKYPDSFQHTHLGRIGKNTNH